MKKTINIILLLLATFQIYAQSSLKDISFGTDETFEVITWNIEWFPKNGQITIDSVTTIIEALDVDVIALQEIDQKDAFEELVNNLDGWDAFFVDDEYSGLAYIYKTDKIEITSIYEIYTEQEYWRPFPRSPLVMEMSYSGHDFVIVNNHLKCCGDGILNLSDKWDEETRRYDACNLLRQFFNDNFQNKNIILLGDLNDILTDNFGNNVFQVFLSDPYNYKFADMKIAEGSSYDWSYPNWPSHLDHILISNELFELFNNSESVIKTIRVDDFLRGGISEYDDLISDHRPVALKMNFNYFAVNKLSNNNLEINISPNPITNRTTISFEKSTDDRIIKIYNICGKEIESIPISKNQEQIIWKAKSISKGIYFVKLINSNGSSAVSKISVL